MKTKCNKCDERGYIQETKYLSHSCPCGWAIQQQEIAFKNSPEGQSIEKLFAYAHKRIAEKRALTNN